MPEYQRRRRRQRHSPEGEGGTATESGTVAGPAAEPDEEAPAEERETERGLRGLVGGGSSQIKTTAAMRARDATRPTEEDLSRAEANLTIIRRGWKPPPPDR